MYTLIVVTVMGTILTHSEGSLKRAQDLADSYAKVGASYTLYDMGSGYKVLVDHITLALPESLVSQAV